MNRELHTRQPTTAAEVFHAQMDALDRLALAGRDHAKAGSPWLSDATLLGIAFWWVKETRGPSADFHWQVAREFTSLARDLRHESL
jgi:hypothetical protein